ncbi:MAG: hypothetical protein K1X71_15575 [Pirellulales bacterium]|nr:hypothetical protein [Pirellulales bacterium]
MGAIIASWKRGLASLAIVLAAFWLYALIAVPLIEPSVELSNVAASTAAERQAARDRPAVRHEELADWFGPQDWELTSPKVLETARGKLLFREYENGKDGTLRFRPCTVILLGERGDKSEEQWKREAIILQAPDGADLKFDSPLSIGSGKLGKLVAGHLRGRFTIRSDQRAPGPADDLLITSQDALLADNRITSQHPIQFRLAGSYGSGRELRIDLMPSEGESEALSFDGIAGIEVRRNVVMNLNVDELSSRRSGQPQATQPAPAQAVPLAGQTGPQPPIRITSQGPFRFDMTQFVATFKEQVDVLRMHAQGQSDHLHGDLLSLFFAAPPGASLEPGRFGKLLPNRIEVRGLPVVMESTLEDMDARGELLIYEFSTRRMTLEGKQPVTVRRGESRIQAPRLLYEPPLPSARSRFGRFSATGPGFLDAVRPDRPGEMYRARWSKHALFGPEQQFHLVSLVGDAWFHDARTGALEGEEVYVWLVEQSPPNPAPATATSPQRAPPFIPDRMLARGGVRLESQQVTCNVEELQVWFAAAGGAAVRSPIEELPLPQAPGRALPPVAPPRGQPTGRIQQVGFRGAPPPRAVPRSAAPVQYQYPVRTPSPPPSTNAAPTAFSGELPPPQNAKPLGPGAGARYFVQGKLLQVQLRMQGATAADIQLQKLRVVDNVRVTEAFHGTPDGAPLVVTGQQLDYEQTNNLDGKLAVIGEPAHVEGRGVTLDGPVIRLNRGESTMDVDGAGAMILPANAQIAVGPSRSGATTAATTATTTPIVLNWQKQLHFDGRIAHFTDRVVAKLDQRTLRAGALDVAFSQPVNFANPPRGQGGPEVAELFCSGGLILEGRTVESGRQTSVERMEAKTLRVNRLTGAIFGDGPGSLETVRIGQWKLPTAPGQSTDLAAVNPGEERLLYLKVEFLTRVTGNLNDRITEFGNRVRTVFGPVTSWDGVVRRDDLDRVGADGKPLAQNCGTLDSSRLTVARLQAPDGTTSVALDASGDAKLDGVNFYQQSFRAIGNHIKYEQAKDQIILEGDGRADAVLARYEHVWDKPQYSTSRKITFWPSTSRVHVDGAHQMDLAIPGRSMPAQLPGTAPFVSAPPRNTYGNPSAPPPALEFSNDDSSAFGVSTGGNYPQLGPRP